MWTLACAQPSPCSVYGVPPGASLGRLTQWLADGCLEEMGSTGAQLSVVTQDNQAHAAAGYLNGDEAERVSTDDLFRIASATKTFTAALALMEVQNGGLSLDDTLDRFVANVPNGERITVRHLLGHRSGLANYTKSDELMETPSAVRTPQELLDAAIDLGTRFEPGQCFEYSNTNYVLLAMVMEKLTGEAYGSLLRHRIFEPFSLRHTYLEGYDSVGFNVTGYDTEDRDVSTLFDPSMVWAAGAIVSTATDLARWTHLLYDGTVVAEPLLTEMMDPGRFRLPTAGYGLGAVVIGIDLQKVVGHPGDHPNGFTALMLYMPSSKTAVVALVNKNPAPLWSMVSAAMKAATRKGTPAVPQLETLPAPWTVNMNVVQCPVPFS